MSDATRTRPGPAGKSAAPGEPNGGNRGYVGTETRYVGAGAVGPDADDDEQLARMYVRMWSLASGRRLRPGARLTELSAEELIAFWADDFAGQGGRHARVQASWAVAA